MARLASGGRHGFAQSLFQVGGNAGAATGPLLAAFDRVAERAAEHRLVRRRGPGGDGHPHAGRSLVQAPRPFAGRGRGSAAIAPRLPSDRVRWALVILVLLVFSKNVYLASMSSFYTFYLIDKFELIVRSAQLHLFVLLAAVAAGTFIGGPVGDRIGRKYVIWVSILGVLPFTLLLPHANLFWTEILSVVIGLILASAFSAIVVFAQELVPGRVGNGLGRVLRLRVRRRRSRRGAARPARRCHEHRTVYQVCSFLPAIGLLTWFLPDCQ